MFGRGRGEALVIHLGHGRWITVDSFIEPSSRQPIALQYLASIGVDPSAVDFVVATHWDKDHISGIARIVQAASVADVVLSLALRSPDFINLAFRHQQRTYASPLGSGTKEFVRLVELLEKQERAPRFVLQDTVLADRYGMRLVALSPSSSVALDALSAASVAALEAGATGDSIVEPTPNAASVVLAIRCAGGDVLLGADLEKPGWQLAVAAVSAEGLRARMFKVPHHGSDDADAPSVWQNQLRSDAVYAVTRFNNGARSLPSNDDRSRMRTRNAQGHIVGPPSTRRHLHGIVGRRVRAATREGIWQSTGPVGHYRWRGNLAELTSSTDTYGAVERI